MGEEGPLVPGREDQDIVRPTQLTDDLTMVDMHSFASGMSISPLSFLFSNSLLDIIEPHSNSSSNP